MLVPLDKVTGLKKEKLDEQEAKDKKMAEERAAKPGKKEAKK